MARIFKFIGMSLGGWLGWKVGLFVNVPVAFLISTIGSGFGLYFAIRLGHELLP